VFTALLPADQNGLGFCLVNSYWEGVIGLTRLNEMYVEFAFCGKVICRAKAQPFKTGKFQ
jgi:hypothetical protein